MKNLVLDIASFLKSLTVIDYVLYFAILILLLLIVSLIYLLKTTDIEEEEIEQINEDDINLKDLTKTLENRKPEYEGLTEYEQEQEQKAIISYDELLNSVKNNNISYDDEYMEDTVRIKKVNLDTLAEERQKPHKVISLEHEEAFLQSLKKLQKLLD